MPAVLAAGLGPVYLGRFWGVIHPMSMPSLATAAGPSYFFWPAGSGPLSGQTILATWELTCSRPRKVARTSLKWSICDISGSTITKILFFVRKENKNDDFIQQFLLFCVSLQHAFTRILQCIRVVLLMRSDVEPSLFTHRRCTLCKIVSVNMSEDWQRMTCNFCPALLIWTRIYRQWTERWPL